MATDQEIETIISEGDSFCPTPKILFTSPIEDITRDVIECGESGVPCVITGFPLVGDERSPFRQSREWMESVYANRVHSDAATNAHSTEDAHNATGPTLSCPPEWLAWLQDSFIVPGCLVPQGGNDLLPEGTQSASLRLSGPEHDSPFQDDSCSTTTHDLLCIGDTSMSKDWFMTAAKDWPEVTEHLRTRSDSNRIPTRTLSLEELSESPFNIYVHRQRKGDLMILPPRSFSQTIHRGITASLHWERMTLQGLEMFIYHDRIFKQRVCTKIRYHPHQILCNTVLELHRELFNLKQSQPNDLSLFSAKSGTLKRAFALLDEVVKSSYCLQDELLPLIKLSTPPPPCSFCGGELFRTVFRCKDSCVRDDAISGSVDCKILICNLCFIDGRACRCGSMEPSRLQPLAELIELRENVVDLLGLSDDHGPAWSHQNPRECGEFNAARTLCEAKAKETQPVERSCTIAPSPSHRVPRLSVIFCRRCHANRCYKHILSTFHVHYAQAVKVDLADPTSTLWHNFHKEMRDKYATNYSALRVAIRAGSSCPLNHRLAYYASLFVPTMPLNQAVALGFYDNPENTVAEDPRANAAPAVIETDIPQRLRRRGSNLRSSTPTQDTQDVAPPVEETSVRRRLRRQGSSLHSSTPTQDTAPPVVETDMRRRLRRRSSSLRSLTVGEGSSSQKRRLSPPEEGTVANKRVRRSESRRSEPSSSQTMEVIREETTLSRELGRDVGSEEDLPQGESSRNCAGSSGEGDGCTTPPPRPPIQRYQRSSGNSRQVDEPSSPLHHPLAFFDPDTDLVVRKPNSSQSEYSSAWDQLLIADTTNVPQPDPNRTSVIEQAMLRVSTRMTTTQATPSFPSLASVQRPNRTNGQIRTYGEPKPREVHLPAQQASSDTRTSQTAFRQGNRERSITPAPRQGPSTSRSVSQAGGGTRSTGPTASEFSFRIPNQASHTIHRGGQNDRNLHSVPTGYRSGDRDFAGSTPHSIQAPSQISAVPPRSRKLIVGNSLSSENLNMYAEILRESQKEWEALHATNNYIPDKMGYEFLEYRTTISQILVLDCC